jgi:hypothetical protein
MPTNYDLFTFVNMIIFVHSDCPGLIESEFVFQPTYIMTTGRDSTYNQHGVQPPTHRIKFRTQSPSNLHTSSPHFVNPSNRSSQTPLVANISPLITRINIPTTPPDELHAVAPWPRPLVRGSEALSPGPHQHSAAWRRRSDRHVAQHARDRLSASQCRSSFAVSAGERLALGRNIGGWD